MDAKIPMDYLSLVPTKMLKDHQLAIYESAGSVVLAAPYPLPDKMRETIAKAAGSKLSFDLSSTEAIASIRRNMLHEIDLYEIDVSTDDLEDGVIR